MAELGSYENQEKRFLANFNILQAPPKKKRKQMMKKKWFDYLMSGHVRKFISVWKKKEFKWLEDTANGMHCNIRKSFQKIGTFIVNCSNYRKSTISKAQNTTGPQDYLT